MWWGDFTFELGGTAGWWRSILSGCTPVAEATFRGQLVIVGIKGRQTIQGGCNTRWMLYSVYAVLSVNSWTWHGEIERDDLTLSSAMMVEKERWGMKMGTIWRIWADLRIQYTTCLIGFRKPRISVVTCWIRSSTCRIRNGQFTRTQNCVQSQVLMMISPISYHLSLSLPSPKNTKLSHSYLSLHAMISS